MYVSAVHASILIVNDVLGIGLLNMPYVTKYCGVSNLIILLVVLTFITILTIITITYCSDISQTVTYEGAVRTVCGSIAFRITAFMLAVHAFFDCVTLLVITGDQWKEAKDYYCIVNPWYMQKAFIVSVTSVFLILPLCYLERIEFLAYPSGLGVVGITYISVLVVVKYFMISEAIEAEPTRSYDVGSVSLAVTSLMFAYEDSHYLLLSKRKRLCQLRNYIQEGHLPILPIYSCMTVRKLKTFCNSVIVAVCICTVFYGITGIFGYLTFEEAVASDIFLSYEPKLEIFVGVLMLCLKTYTTYPLIAFSGREALISLWDEFSDFSEKEKLKYGKKRRIIVSSIWFTLSLIAALYIPFIGIIVRYEGVLSFLFVLILPGLCLFFLKEDGTHSLLWTIIRLIAASMLIVAGVFLMGTTLVQCIQTDIIHPDEIQPDKSKYTC